MRDFSGLTGRRLDAFERHPAGDTALVLVGLGMMGESLLAGVERLRAAAHDVGALKLTVLRPFPGARLVKALSRALAVSVIEASDEPLAQSNPLTREIKSSFADALTWAPDYPGIGRIPRVLSGIAEAAHLEAHDFDAIVHNMLADERGRRFFVVAPHEESGDAPSLAPAPPARHHDDGSFTMRGRLREEATAAACADLCSELLTMVLGLRARASVRELGAAEGAGFAFDLVAGRDRPRGVHAPHAMKLIALEDPSLLIAGNPLLRLAPGGVLAVPSQELAPDAIWRAVPPYVKAIVHDRDARSLP